MYVKKTNNLFYMKIALPMVKMSAFINKRNGSYLFLALQIQIFFDMNSVYCFTTVLQCSMFVYMYL